MILHFAEQNIVIALENIIVHGVMPSSLSVSVDQTYIR